MLDLIARESAADSWPAIDAIAEAAREQQGPGILAILFYGSVRRDRDDEGGIVDLYLLAESYASLRGSWLRRVFIGWDRYGGMLATPKLRSAGTKS